MTDVKRVDDELYKAIFIFRDIKMYEDIWKIVKRNPIFQREAVKLKRDKFDEADTVTGLAIVDTMLKNYQEADPEAYNELIESIYSNVDIARTVIDGAANGGYSFLLMSLWNPNVKLTEEQKNIAVSEAMNKIGTVRWNQNRNEFSDQLDEMGITDDETVMMSFDGLITPIGRKAGSQYMNFMFACLSDEQAHGVGEYDIRYYILKNPNWSVEEKQKLAFDFWYNDETYDEYLERWEWGIVNDNANYHGGPMSLLEKDYLYDYTFEDLVEFYKGDKKTAKRIYDEIQFCKLMHQLRPQQWEKDIVVKEKK